MSGLRLRDRRRLYGLYPLRYKGWARGSWLYELASYPLPPRALYSLCFICLRTKRDRREPAAAK